MYKKARKKISILIFLITIIAALFITVNYNNYLLAEKKINYDRIEHTLEKIDHKLSYIYKIGLKYANWDNTYNFLEGTNNSYVYKNFREGSYTLEDLDIDFFILKNKKKEVVFSKYTKNMEDIDKLFFKKNLHKKLLNKNKYQSILKIEDNSYFIVKLPIHKSDFTEKYNGFLYLGILITEDLLREFTRNANKSSFILNEVKLNNPEEIATKNLSKILLESDKKEKFFSNTIQILNEDSNNVLTFNTSSKLELLDELSKMLITFVLAIIAIIIALIYIYFKFKKELLENEELVNTKVNAKTNQIKVAMLELEKVNGKLYDIAHTDFLTKTMNRRNFFMHAQNAFNITKKENKSLTVLMVDLDNFKCVNDNYGHDIGDEVLIAFANKVKENINEEDIFGRLGGEEFAIVFSNITLEEAVKKAEELKSCVEEIEINTNTDTLQITASFGVSDNQNCKNIDEMLQVADKQLYNAKHSGRNAVRSRLNIED